MKYKDLASIPGLTARLMKVNGKAIKCMVKDYYSGKMAKAIKAALKTI